VSAGTILLLAGLAAAGLVTAFLSGTLTGASRVDSLGRLIAISRVS